MDEQADFHKLHSEGILSHTTEENEPLHAIYADDYEKIYKQSTGPNPAIGSGKQIALFKTRTNEEDTDEEEEDLGKEQLNGKETQGDSDKEASDSVMIYY